MRGFLRSFFPLWNFFLGLQLALLYYSHWSVRGLLKKDTFLKKSDALKEVLAVCAGFLFSSKPFQRQFQRAKISKNKLQEDF